MHRSESQSRADRAAAPSAAELSAQAVAAYTSAKERKMPAVPRRDETNVLVRTYLRMFVVVTCTYESM